MKFQLPVLTEAKSLFVLCLNFISKLRFGLTLVMTMATSGLYGQLNLPAEKGYIVTTQNDTIRGLIRYTRERNVFRTVDLTDGSGVIREYVPSELACFYLEKTNEMFVSTQTFSRNPLGYNGFVRILVDGPAKLYSFKDSTRTKYWLRKDGVPVGLRDGTKETKRVGNYTYEVQSRPYMKTIKNILYDCNPDTTFDFSNDELVAAVVRYADCKSQPSNVYANSRKGKWVLGGAIGVVSSALRFIDKGAVTEPYKYPKGAPVGSYDLSILTDSTLKTAGIQAGLVASFYPANNKHLSFVLEMLFQERRWSGDRVELKLGYLQFPLSIRYNFLLDHKIQPVLGFGFDPAINVYSNYNKESYMWTFRRAHPRVPGSGDTYPDVLNVEMPTFIEKEFNPNAFYPFVTAGVDLQQKRLSVYVFYRYEFSGSITKSPLYDTSVTSHNFMICVTPHK